MRSFRFRSCTCRLPLFSLVLELILRFRLDVLLSLLLLLQPLFSLPFELILRLLTIFDPATVLLLLLFLLLLAPLLSLLL